MAAKAPAPHKAKAKTVAKHQSKAKAKSKGLNLTPAQFQAYIKAYNAEATLLRKRLQIAAARKATMGAARGYRKYQLKAAYGMMKRYNAAYHNAQAAAVALHATRMSYMQARLAHQNRALIARVQQDVIRHATLLGRAQYIQAGERAFAHSAVMRTVTQAQALSIEAKFFAKLVKKFPFKKSKKKFGKKFKPGPNSAAINKAATAAGLAAAHRISPKVKLKPGPKSKARPRPKPVKKRGRPLGSKGKTNVRKNLRKTRAKIKHNAAVSAHSKKAPVKKAKARTAPAVQNTPAIAAAYAHAYAQAMAGAVRPHVPPVVSKTWHGDEVTPNCVIIAVANHVLFSKGTRVDEAHLHELESCCPAEPTIEEVLWQVWLTGWPTGSKVRLKTYFPAGRPWDQPGRIIGYETENGDHAALSLEDGKVVSWGSETERTAPVEEAWELIWEN